MVLFWYQSKFNNVSDFMKHISKNPTALNLMLQVSLYIYIYCIVIEPLEDLNVYLKNFKKYYRQKNVSADMDTSSSSNELGNILNQENLIIEQVTSILRVAQKQDVISIFKRFISGSWS